MAEPPVLVTGGTGVVGTAIVRRLLADGRPVRGLARSDWAAGALAATGASPVRGDILDVGSLQRAMDGCTVVYHVAGVNQFCLRDPAPMHEANVTGSANCVVAAAAAGVRRLVYTSSAVTLGEADGTVGREDSPHRGTFLSAYERSKYDAEAVVFQEAERLGVDVISVNPSSVQGPGRSSGTGKVLVLYLRGKLRFWVDTTISLVDLDDCAEGHLLAEAKGEAGRRYVLSGASLSSDELMSVMRGIAPGVKPPRMVPATVVSGVVGAASGVARLRGRTPMVCRESLRTLLHGHRYDGSLAERELGLSYRPVEDTLRRTAAWLVSEGTVPVSSLG
ncbi:MAG: NAD-dependent epimerase/dehydratase family protein [Acidimicrobiales bacterium]